MMPIRWCFPAVLSVLAVVAVACVPAGSRHEVAGDAVVRFDGQQVGYGGPSGIRCISHAGGSGPWFFKTREPRFKIGGDPWEDWKVDHQRAADQRDVDQRYVELHLEIAPDQVDVAAVRLAIGKSVYQSRPDTPTRTKPGWDRGSAVFTSLPLAEGRPYQQMKQIERLVIRWSCLPQLTSRPEHG